MGLFDKIKSEVSSAASSVVNNAGNKTEKIVFSPAPETIEAFKALPQAAMTSPFDTAALAVLALAFFPLNKELCYEAVDFLRGPRPMNGMEKQFISDRFRDKDYVLRSYFEGATPANDYMPAEPYTIAVSSDPHSYETEGIARLYIKSSGADLPRPISMRKAKDGKWYLWEYSSAMLSIRVSDKSDPWA